MCVWSLEFSLPQLKSMVNQLGVGGGVGGNRDPSLSSRFHIVRFCPVFWSLQMAHLSGRAHTNIWCSVPTLASMGQGDALCELKYLCEQVQLGATGGGSSGRMACTDSSSAGVSPLVKGELGGSNVQPWHCSLDLVSWRWLWNHLSLFSSLGLLPFQAGENPRPKNP